MYAEFVNEAKPCAQTPQVNVVSARLPVHTEVLLPPTPNPRPFTKIAGPLEEQAPAPAS